MAEVGAGAAHGRSGIAARSDPSPAGASERPDMAKWQRQSSAGGCRADLLANRTAGGVAESNHLVGERKAGAVLRSERREDDVPLRLGAAGMLDAGQW